MGHWIECKKCKKVHRYDSSEIKDVGTLWHPIWVAKCRSCGSAITSDQGKFFQTGKGVEIRQRIPELSGRERAEKGDIKEYWAQEYVRENYKKLGFSEIEGPFETGPDFRGVFKGKNVSIEVERSCESFVTHGHHTDQRFKRCVLIVLNPSKLSREAKKKLPKKIIRIDTDDFVEWWRPKARAYAKVHRKESIIKLIAKEFQKRFLAICFDKDREMSTCPECDFCPYFGGFFKEAPVPGQASDLFEETALKFLALHRHPIERDDFKLTDIDPSEINKFFLSHLDFFLPIC